MCRAVDRMEYWALKELPARLPGYLKMLPLHFENLNDSSLFS